MDPNLRIAIQTIYQKVDEAVKQAGPKCEASGRCCRFAEYGHTLFLSQLEAEYLLASAPPFSSVDPAVCPFQVESLCTAREPRPLGCRVYFCDPNYQEEGQRISEQGIRELKALADEHGLAWRYAPLHVFLKEHREQFVSQENASADQNPPVSNQPHKIPLPMAT